MTKKYTSFLIVFVFIHLVVSAQEIRTFKVEDFDLRGKVKTCLVITSYGKELFEFDEEGRLTRTVTQYNESDQDITLYKYKDGELVEKRMESYKDDILDASTSMVNFFSIDSVSPRKVLEKIISYDKQFLEQQEYQYNEEGKLEKVIISNAEGVDETSISYQQYRNEKTQSISHNGVIEKTERVSEKKVGNKTHKIVLTKEFVDGDPNTAEEQVFDESGKLLSSESFSYDPIKKEFASAKKTILTYDIEGKLSKETVKTENATFVKEFIFQYDDSPVKNWIKKIITPSNDYSTRRIEYYKEKNEDSSN